MIGKAIFALPLLLSATFALFPFAAAQSSPIEDFAVESHATRVDVAVGSLATTTLTYRDLSRDAPAGVSPGAGGSVLFHTVSIKAVPVEEKTGWQVILTPTSMVTAAGDVREVTVQFTAEPNARDAFYPVDIHFVFRGNTVVKNSTVHLLGYSLGLSAFTAQVSDVYLLKPKQIVDVPVTIRNNALSPRAFDMRVTDNPCGMVAVTTNGNVVDERSVDRYTVSIQAPSDKLWFQYDSCPVTIEVRPQDNPSQVRTATINVNVAGWYVKMEWKIWFVEALLVILLIVFLVKRRKERIEEEILGKPQKPWTIPVEALYLKALKEKDERAWYVVRHHLMEEEYRSSLLWYKSYKAATKGSRKKETLVLRQEKKYKRWRAKWEREIAKPMAQADRFEAKLQRKLDRVAAKAHRKQEGKYATVRAKMEKSYAKKVEAAMAAWEKDTRKAQKKGLPLPKRPTVPEPDYPPEPTEQPIALADHKWNRKAERFRARMVRKQGDLEVKFEKADARKLHRLRRKVSRLARKLDDPTFIDEHPLLRGDAKA